MKSTIPDWADYATARLGAGTVGTYKSHLINFFDWLGSQPLTRLVIEDHVTYMSKRKYSKGTINGRLAALKSWCGWWCPRHDIPNPKPGKLMFKRKETQPKKRRFLTPEEYKKILLVAENGIELDTVELLAHTGLRRSEYVTFDPQSVNKAGTHFRIIGKGRKARDVPVNPKIREVLSRSRNRDGSLMCVTYWKGNAKVMWNWCQSLARRAQIPAFGPHAFRHYFATELIRKGVPIKLVSVILGHSSVVITEQIYCHLLPEDTTGLTDCLCS